MEQLEIVIKNNTRLTFHRYIHVLDKGEWIYHPLERINPGMMISFVCSGAAYQNVLGCNVIYTTIVDSIEYCVNYKYESRIIGDNEANVRIGIVNKDDAFIEIPANSGSQDNLKKLFYLDTTNGVQNSMKKLITHINIRETEQGTNYLDAISACEAEGSSNYDLSKLNSNYYEWMGRLRKYPRSLYIRIVNFSDCDLILQLPAAKKSDNEKFKQRNLATSTISSAVTPSMHLENRCERLLSRGPVSPYSMSNMIRGGKWVEFPPEKIQSFSICEFGAGCESLFSTDFIGSVIYRVSGYAGKVLFSWEFPAGMSPNLVSKGFHDLHNLTVSTHFENFNDGHLIFHVMDESKPLPIRILSVRTIFGDSFLNIFKGDSNSATPYSKQQKKSIGDLSGRRDSEVEHSNKDQSTKRRHDSKANLSNDELSGSSVNNIFGNKTRDISSFFFDYIKPKVVISDDEKGIYLYDELYIDNPRVFFSYLLTNNNININPVHSCDIGSFSLYIEWSIGCIIFRKIWNSDEKLLLNSKLIGGMKDYNVLLGSIYPVSCRRNKSAVRIYPPLSFPSINGCSFSCKNGCFSLLSKLKNYNEPYLLNSIDFSNAEIALIGQQLLSYVLAPFLIKYMKSQTISKSGGGSSSLSNSSRYSNTSTAFQGYVDNDHIWRYSKINLGKGGVWSKDDSNRQGILDFQGTVSFLIFHWDDLFCELFERKLSMIDSATGMADLNPDTILSTLQRVSLLWENKDFELFDDPLFVREFIDVGIVICETIQDDNSLVVSDSLRKLRNSIKLDS